MTLFAKIIHWIILPPVRTFQGEYQNEEKDLRQMPQILCVAWFLTIFQLDWSNALLVILISDYDLLLEKTIG